MPRTKIVPVEQLWRCPFCQKEQITYVRASGVTCATSHRVDGRTYSSKEMELISEKEVV